MFSTIFVCVRSALVPWTDITLKKKNDKPSSSQFSHCSKRGLIILHVYFVFLVVFFVVVVVVLFCFVLFCFFQENVILGSDYPFPLGEHHPGKLIKDVYKDDLELRVIKRTITLSFTVVFFFFFFLFFLAIDKTPQPSSSLLKLPLIVIQKFCYHGNGDMSRIDLVSKNLLANFLRNCRKRNN